MIRKDRTLPPGDRKKKANKQKHNTEGESDSSGTITDPTISGIPPPQGTVIRRIKSKNQNKHRIQMHPVMK